MFSDVSGKDYGPPVVHLDMEGNVISEKDWKKKQTGQSDTEAASGTAGQKKVSDDVESGQIVSH